ncbi:MAG TPA: site-2 protease family protein, partial [Acidimicrobiia bacterium]|nr:site-2 protease family protein [Acidimicrobiia bacterium]
MFGGIAAFVGLLVFVTAHEAGHFLAAKATGIKATEFFFGFGPRIWSKQIGETEYGIKAVPFGGYVRIIGMNPLEDIAPQDMGRTYREKKFSEKSLVVVAGVGTNFLLGFLMFWGVFGVSGVNEVLPTVDEVVPETPVVDGVVVADDTEDAELVGSPALKAGLEAGDEVIAIGDQKVSSWGDMTAALEAEGPGPTTVTVTRNGTKVTLDIDLLANPTFTGGTTGYLGVRPVVVERAVGPIESFGFAGQALGGGIGNTFHALYEIFRPSSLAQYVGVLGGDT